jgi:nucleotide-binding universal stress UspA family protein
MATVLLATDGSGEAAHAVHKAVQYAWDLSATLHVLCVVDRWEQSEAALSSAALATIAAEDAAFAAVEEAAAQAERLGINVVSKVVHGSPVETILEYADEINADVIVLGKHGDHSHHLGGVGRRIVSQAGCETVVVD